MLSRGIKSILLAPLLLLLTFQLNAQPKQVTADWLDDLLNEIEKEDTEKLIEATKINLQESRDIKRYDLESQYLKKLGYIHLLKTKNLELAMEYAVESLSIDERHDYNAQLLFSNMLLASIFKEVDDYYNAAEFTEKALRINRDLNFEALQISLKQQLGDIFVEMAAYEKAQEQYENILAYAKSSRYPKLEATNWYQIGLLEQMQNNHQLAINAFLNALKIHRRINDLDKEATTLLAIGKSYDQMDSYEKALENYKVALNIWRSLDSPLGLAKVYNALGALFNKNKEFQRATANLRYALTNSQKSQNQMLIMESYRLMSLANKGLGKFKEAFEYQELQSALEDFIENEKNDRAILKMQNRYTLGKQQNTIDQLEFNKVQRENELTERTRQNNFLTILIGLSIVILILILILFITQRKSNTKLKAANEEIQDKNKELEEVNATKDKFFSIISHDLKGPLNSLTSFSGLLMNHTDSLSKEEIQMLAKDLDKSLKNLFALLENLLQWSRSQTGNIEFKKEPFNLTEVLKKNKDLLTKQAGNKQIEIELKQEDPIEVKAHEQSIDTVVRNLVSNAIKFTNEGGKIKMGVSENDTYYYVKVADNGVGMSPKIVDQIFKIDSKHSTQGTAKEKGTGLGLILCKEFVEKNGGTIGVKSKEDKGSMFYFSIPKN
jgi:signal transduction histidine kinase